MFIGSFFKQEQSNYYTYLHIYLDMYHQDQYIGSNKIMIRIKFVLK